jgi:hypothetical protein
VVDQLLGKTQNLVDPGAEAHHIHPLLAALPEQVRQTKDIQAEAAAQPRARVAVAAALMQLGQQIAEQAPLRKMAWPVEPVFPRQLQARELFAAEVADLVHIQMRQQQAVRAEMAAVALAAL